MGDALGLQEIFFSTLAGAAIVLFGAFYALFFALGRLHSSRLLALAANLAYLLLATAAWVLVDALALDGLWLGVTAVMLLGYFFLPRAIWQLCVGTHAADSTDADTRQATRAAV